MEDIYEKRNEREVLLEFIQTYRDHPALWKVKSKAYYNKIARSKGISALQDILKELEPYCTRDDVIKKINCLRGSFRREYRKIENSKKCATSPSDVYMSSLWYFEEMLFVLDQDVPRESCANLDDINNLNTEIAEADGTEDATPCTSQQVKRRRKTLPKFRHILHTVPRKLDESVPKDESGIDLFGSYVARRIHSMDQRTAIITRKLINDVLFEAEMGSLNSSSRLISTPQETAPLPIPSNTSIMEKWSSTCQLQRL
ncbi:hypothetical protein SK128_012776 [Halocaridina rubra]|uniref:MADF domain-containing protein n=1 Tax=Halocaridina rubra TaxID=373956 RepID=A0AAN9A0K5_HALRR